MNDCNIYRIDGSYPITYVEKKNHVTYHLELIEMIE